MNIRQNFFNNVISYAILLRKKTNVLTLLLDNCLFSDRAYSSTAVNFEVGIIMDVKLPCEKAVKVTRVFHVFPFQSEKGWTQTRL